MHCRQSSSHHSTTNDLVEVGRGIGIRDSKAPASHLAVNREAWTAFLGIVKACALTTR
ncbi:DUF397 domain-containing protein [Lentzea sp. NEAU-D13]|uniref:DUF397 domain-containing protein n=1 Tax=Lentzea alba TaxID=2714351 RepID=A0A7C9VLP9_9PSEU|nr:DUF397 domain-containing protein [Lentzea alba]